MRDDSEKILIGPTFGITREDREKRSGHRGLVIWMTGLSGSGKSTISVALDRRLFNHNMKSIALDGDHVRQGLSKDLGFSPEDRTENLRRVAHVARLFAEQGHIVITSFISPLKSDREQARDILKDDFHECYLEASLELCEQRDPKGLYKLARAGKIQQFTGIDAPFEPPTNADLVLPTATKSVEACEDLLWNFILEKSTPSK